MDRISGKDGLENYRKDWPSVAGSKKCMIYVHSIGRAARYYPDLVALSVRGQRLTFLELHQRIERIAAALHQLGFRAGDRLAVLLPNESEYLELIYACSRLGIIVVPLNTRVLGTGDRSCPDRL